MVRKRDLLIEIGTEELPPRDLLSLSRAFTQGIQEGLVKAGLVMGDIRSYATPRRLGMLIHDLPERRPDQRRERRGPALTAAFDRDGKPTKAATGFASSCGVSVEELQTVQTEKGSWIAHVSIRPGSPTSELIPELLRAALAELPIPKRMRWADLDEEFVRPVHWLVVLFGDEIIPATLFGKLVERATRGHRFHHPEPIFIPEPVSYGPLLETEGKVIADFGDRREAIRAQAEAAAISVGGHAVIDSALLDEVTALVEWPVVLAGDFEHRFLAIPPEVLISTMHNHQKYFPVADGAGKLLPHFIATVNIESKDPEKVKAGNERVIRPRFSDAEFFWRQDRKQPLAHRRDGLKGMIYQHRLGSLFDKSERIEDLARFIAELSGGHQEWAARAAHLAKCDLLTHMVQEFPELQGIMGRYYAQHDMEPGEVARAIEEQYQPRFSGDQLPATTTGRVLALADRLDTLVGIFGIGMGPSGAKDPFALRRAALGVLRILIEREIDLDLENLLEKAAQNFDPGIKTRDVVDIVFQFMMERLRSYYLDRGIKPDTFDAVLECRPTRPVDFDRRVRAVEAFRRLPAAESLAAANKRIRNLLRQTTGPLPFEVRTNLLVEIPEQTLAGRLAELSSEAIPLMEIGLYQEALSRIAQLREPVDAFFDGVMVMTEDMALRHNRIALLNELISLFLRIADFSRLQE